MTRNTPFMLKCEAVGPPDPVQIRWLRDGLPDSDFHNSPSSYSVSGEAAATQSGFLHFSVTHTENMSFTVSYLVEVILLSLLLPVPLEVLKSPKKRCPFLLFSKK